MTLNNLGILLSDMGRIEEAKQRYEKTLEIFTEPMQYLTTGKKSHSIIKLIDLNSKIATEEKEPLDRIGHLREVYRLCKKYQEFFIRYELRNERELVTEAGLNAYIDCLIKEMKLESGFEKRAEKYGKALEAVKRLEKLEKDETILRLYISAACYLEGRKYINEAMASGKTELGRVSEAVEKFKEASKNYKKADMCYNVYSGLLKILEYVEGEGEIEVPELEKVVVEVVKPFENDVSLAGVKASFESIPKIFQEDSRTTWRQRQKEFEEKVSLIESKALEKLFGHVNRKINNYFEKPFNPNISYKNWMLEVKFDDPEKIKGKLTIRAGNRILFDRALSRNEIENNLIEIDYLEEKYIPKGKDEIRFTIPGQKKPVVEQIDYFETINRNKKTRIFLHDASDRIRIGKNVRIAAVQLKYHAYEENSIVKIKADDAYERKVMSILETVNGEVDIVVFPEFSIPFEYLGKMQEYANENRIVVVAGSHYVSDKNLGEYGKLFSRSFDEDDLRKNISPIIIPNSKIIHNEKFLGAREERPAFFDKGMEIGKINNVFKLGNRLNVGVMICYEFLNTELRHRLLPVCDIILVPQTNPKPESFYEEAEIEINRPVAGGTRAFVMANGIFTIGDKKEVAGGSTGVYLTLDKYSKEKKDDAVITPVSGVMEQFILIASINKDFYPAWDGQTGQEPITLKLIHIFEEAEIPDKLKEKGREFVELINRINSCNDRIELKCTLIKERESVEKKEDGIETSLIKQFSPLMNKHIQKLDELKLEQLKEKCLFLVIPNN